MACNDDENHDNTSKENIKNESIKALNELSKTLVWKDNNCESVYENVIQANTIALNRVNALKKSLSSKEANLSAFIERNIETRLLNLDNESNVLKERCTAPDYDAEGVSIERPAMLRAMLSEWQGTINLLINQLKNTPKINREIEKAILTKIDVNQFTNSGFTFKDCSDDFCPQMTVIPAGSYEMGGTTEEHLRENVPQQSLVYEIPQHHVKVEKAFAMATFETTVGQFKQFQKETGWDVQGCRNWEVRNNEFSMWYRDDLNPSNPGIYQTDKDPVVCVRREDGREFVKWLSIKTGQSYRLPSEAEWEYAARGGTTSTYYWGNDPEKDKACKYANVLDISTVNFFQDTSTWSSFKCNDGYSSTAPVGQFLPNTFGLYDMSANAREWVDDCWHQNYEGAPSTATIWGKDNGGVCNFPVLRGGSWIYNTYNVRTAYRNAYVSTQARSNMWGFRVVRDL